MQDNLHERIPLLVYCASISSNFVCSELRGKSKQNKSKTKLQTLFRKEPLRTADLLNSGLHCFAPQGAEQWLRSVQGSREPSLQFSRFKWAQELDFQDFISLGCMCHNRNVDFYGREARACRVGLRGVAVHAGGMRIEGLPERRR